MDRFAVMLPDDFARNPFLAELDPVARSGHIITYSPWQGWRAVHVVADPIDGHQIEIAHEITPSAAAVSELRRLHAMQTIDPRSQLEIMG